MTEFDRIFYLILDDNFRDKKAFCQQPRAIPCGCPSFSGSHAPALIVIHKLLSN